MARKLTMLQMVQLGLLKRKHREAKDEDRILIEQQMRELLGESEETEEDQNKQAQKKQKPREDQVRLLSDLPFAPYVDDTEIAIMVDDGDTPVYYGEFRNANPGQNVFDLDPDKVDVVYFNQRIYAELEEPDPLKAVNRCMRRLPKAIEPVTLAIINGLLFNEALYDPRIKKLGYTGETMYDFEDKGLFQDFYDSVIYNALHTGMTLEEARALAKEEPSETDQSQHQPQPQSQSKPQSQESQSQPKPQPEQQQSQPQPQSQPKQSPTRKRSRFI